MIFPLYAELLRLTEARSFLVAYSGGVDSHVLLFALSQLRQQYPDLNLRAMYVNHGLSELADDWQDHCAQVCQQLSISFVSESVRVDAQQLGVEAAAREVRYAALAKHLLPQECLLTAHNRDDQAETLLLQLLRGAGPKGLSAMPRKKVFLHSLHLRPLLSFSRQEIECYAHEHHLQWIEDESNQEQRFDRNYLRHQVMPLITQRWPSATKLLARSAMHCGAAEALLTEFAQEDVVASQGSQAGTLSVSGILQLSSSRRSNVLRYWLQAAGCVTPTTAQLLQIESDVLNCNVDAAPVFIIDGKELRRYRDDLFCIESQSIDPDLEIQWDCQSVLTLPHGLGVIKPYDFAGYKQLTVRLRRGGELIKLNHSSHHQSLKKLFQQWGVPTWQRDRVPLIFDGDRLISVLGYC